MEYFIYFQTACLYIGAVIGLYAHIPMWKDIRNGSKSYSAMSYSLWAILDTISAYTLYEISGNWILPATFGVCASVTALFLIYKKQFSLSSVDYLVILLISITLGVWNTYGSYLAFVCSIISLIIASLPQIKNFIDTPSKEGASVYKIFFVSSLISSFSARELSLAELAYPLCATILCFIMYKLADRKALSLS